VCLKSLQNIAWLGTVVHKKFNYYALRNENMKCLLCYFDNYSIKTIEVTMTLSTSSRYPIARMLRRNCRYGHSFGFENKIPGHI
jgi:hypothetical protein